MNGSLRFRSGLALVMTAGILSACGTAPPSSPLTREGAAKRAPAHLEISQASETAPRDPMAGLNLTTEQQQQLQAIEQGSSQSGSSDELQRQLLASEIDPLALKGLLKQSETDLAKAVDDMVKVREILTPQQRQMLVKALDQPPQGSASATSADSETQLQAMREQLSLTPAQEQAFKTMNAALQVHQKAQQERMQPAYATFMMSGDTTGVRQALEEANQTMPVDAMVGFYGSLSLSQRRSLLGTEAGNDPQS